MKEDLQAKLKEFEQQREITFLNLHRLDAVIAFIRETLEAQHEETNHNGSGDDSERD